MNKKKLFSALTACLFAASLTSCYFFLPNTGNTSSSAYANATGGTTYKTPTYTSSMTKENLNVTNVGLASGLHYLPSTGDVKLLVVPIATTDYSFTSSELDLLEKGFFGSADETGWQSVASYYETSSYGNLHITGEVTETLKLKYTAAALEASMSNGDSGTLTSNLLLSVLDTLEEDYDLTEYDTNNDGYIDAVWLVYAPPYDTSSDLYWAYTTWAFSDSTFDGKYASLYSWASKDFLTAGGYKSGLLTYLADAHTYIHETGHMLGLDDYYSYDADYSRSNPSGNADSPVGGVDMMDFNIGDHDSYSKYLLGWETPTVITEEYLEANSYQLTLSSFTETGQAYLLPLYNSDGEVDYNETPFDEYLLVEYYTPTGLNEKDSEHVYTGNLGTYTQPGVLVYHVDARIGKMKPVSQTELQWDGYAYDRLSSPNSEWAVYYIYTYIYNNTASYCYDQSLVDTGLSFYRGRLISLLPATGKRIDGLKTGYSSNTSLYTAGSSFDSSVYSTFLFDDGSSPKFGFKVNTTSSSDCTLTFKSF